MHPDLEYSGRLPSRAGRRRPPVTAVGRKRQQRRVGQVALRGPPQRRRPPRLLGQGRQKKVANHDENA